jgi:hypothetical protein
MRVRGLEPQGQAARTRCAEQHALLAPASCSTTSQIARGCPSSTTRKCVRCSPREPAKPGHRRRRAHGPLPRAIHRCALPPAADGGELPGMPVRPHRRGDGQCWRPRQYHYSDLRLRPCSTVGAPFGFAGFRQVITAPHMRPFLLYSVSLRLDAYDEKRCPNISQSQIIVHMHVRNRRADVV